MKPDRCGCYLKLPWLIGFLPFGCNRRIKSLHLEVTKSTRLMVFRQTSIPATRYPIMTSWALDSRMRSSAYGA